MLIVWLKQWFFSGFIDDCDDEYDDDGDNYDDGDNDLGTWQDAYDDEDKDDGDDGDNHKDGDCDLGTWQRQKTATTHASTLKGYCFIIFYWYCHCSFIIIIVIVAPSWFSIFLVLFGSEFHCNSVKVRFSFRYCIPNWIVLFQ